MTAKAGVIGTIAALALLVGCSEREQVLPGERLDITAVSGAAGGLEAETPEGSRAIRLPAQSANDAWAQSPVSSVSRTLHPALGTALAPIWSVPIGQGDTRRARITADPVVADGRVFTVDSANMLRATSVAGQPLWEASLVPRRDSPEQGQGGGLAVSGGTVYAASGLGRLVALDAATGAERWVQDLDNTATGAPSVAGGLVYITSGDRTGWAIEADTGRVRWRVDGLGDVNNVSGAPAPAIGAETVTFAFGDAALRTVFRQGGLQLWQARLSGQRTGRALASVDDVTGDPVVVDDRLFAGTHSGRLVALFTQTGERIWTASDGALGPVWPIGDSVFFVSDRNALVRRDAGDGALIWETELPGYAPVRNPSRQRGRAFVNHGPVLAGGRLLVAGSDGALRGFDPESGALVSSTPIQSGATTRPVVAGGVLYLVTRDGDLVAYR